MVLTSGVVCGAALVCCRMVFAVQHDVVVSGCTVVGEQVMQTVLSGFGEVVSCCFRAACGVDVPGSGQVASAGCTLFGCSLPVTFDGACFG